MNTLNIRTLVNGSSNKNYSLWHPFSNLNRHYNNMISFVRGNGTYLYDVDNKEYLDAASGLWNVNLGYGNKLIIGAISNQLSQLQFCSLFDYTNPTAMLAGKKILSILPSYFEKIFFTNSGSESIELSIKVMRQYWSLIGNENKNIIISLENSYHGTFYGSMGVSGIEADHINEYGPLLQNIKFTTPGVCHNCSNNLSEKECNIRCIAKLEEFIKKHSDRIAGIIIEPILASNGVDIVSEKYLKEVRKLCDIYDLLFVVDEVAVGFYRTGHAFYSFKYNLQPDIICMAKGINGGYLPLGAVALSGKVTEIFNRLNATLIHGSTHGGNIISCAACIAAIDIYSNQNIYKNVIYMGEYIKKQLTNKLSEHRNVGQIRGEGLLIGIDIVDNKERYNYLDLTKVISIQEKLRKNGVLVYRSEKGLTVLPMLTINEAEASFIVDTLVKVFNSVLFS